MIRRLFPILSAVSLAIFLAMLALFLRGQLRGDTISWGDAGQFRRMTFSDDAVFCWSLDDAGLPATPFLWQVHRGGFLHPPPPSQRPSARVGTYFLPVPDGEVPPANQWLCPLGLDYAHFPNWYGPGTKLTSVRISFFLPMLPSGILPALWLIAALRRWRRPFPPGHCQKCGYDLRAHNAGQLCPECGMVISTN